MPCADTVADGDYQNLERLLCKWALLDNDIDSFSQRNGRDGI